MRILHVVPSLDPAWGGPPVVAHHLAAGQAELGHHVGLVSFDAPGARSWLDELRDVIPAADRVDVSLLDPPAGLDRVYPRRARRRLRELAGAADVLHLHTVWDPIIVAAANAAAGAKRPYVVCPHGNLDPWSLAQRGLKKRLALRLRYRRLLDEAAFLHVLNADEERLIEPLGLTARSVVIPNGVFFEEFEPLPAPGAFRAAHPEIGDASFVLFLSRLHYKKGLDYLADAFAHLAGADDGVHLVVLGPDGGAQEDFERRIDAAGLAARVHVLGPVYGADKFAALVDAACFCLPSRQEGFSIAIVEALACGLPVVITENCHFPEVAEVEAGAVVSLDASSVGEALRLVMGDAGLRERMGRNGLDLVRARFTWKRIAELSVCAYAFEEPRFQAPNSEHGTPDAHEGR